MVVVYKMKREFLLLEIYINFKTCLELYTLIAFFFFPILHEWVTFSNTDPTLFLVLFM